MEFSERRRRLYRILNAPIRLGLEDSLHDDDGNWYHYLFSTRLLNRADLEQVYRDRVEIRPRRSIDSYLRILDSVFLRGRRAEFVADLGAGWGLASLWFALSGSRVVYSIGDPLRSAWIARIVGLARSEGLLPESSEIRVVSGLIEPGARLLVPELGPSSLDLIVLKDTLEHIAPGVLPSLLSASRAQLKPGGWWVSLSHNSANPRVAGSLRRLWCSIEVESHAPRRREIVRSRIPGLADSDLESLVRRTRGFDRWQLDAAIATFRAGRGWPEPLARDPDGIAAVDPVSSVMEDGYTDRAYVLPLLRAAGFRVRAFPSLLFSRRYAWLQPVARAWPAPFFRFHLWDWNIVYEARALSPDAQVAPLPAGTRAGG